MSADNLVCETFIVHQGIDEFFGMGIWVFIGSKAFELGRGGEAPS
jgi:hypothetical protein